jgi:transcriptional regulator with XRE-family HTH domain
VNGKWFGARLQELRQKTGLSQKELADKAGVSQRAISHWEQGIREPKWSNVLVLAEALGVDCQAFLEEPCERRQPSRGRPRK